MLVPGLLQTRDYMTALFQCAAQFSDDVGIESWAKTRLNRQKRLQGDNPLTLHVVLDEAAIHRLIGGPSVMHGQLAHLLVAGARHNITLQILPYGAGAYGMMSGSVMLVRYPDPTDDPGVYVEHYLGSSWGERPKDVQHLGVIFDHVAAMALSPAQSADLIRDEMKRLETILDEQAGMAKE